MTESYEIRVFDESIDDAEFGCWGLVGKYTNFEDAEKALRQLIEEHGWNDVLWNWESPTGNELAPEDDELYDDYDECGFNPYMGCYDYDC